MYYGYIAKFIVAELYYYVDTADTNCTLTAVCSEYADLVQRGKEVNETPQQMGTAAKEKVVVLRAVCDPSLKESFLACLSACGFRQQTDAILTLARDLVAGRIQYKGGVLQSQQKIDPFKEKAAEKIQRRNGTMPNQRESFFKEFQNQPDSVVGQGGPPAAPESANVKIKGNGTMTNLQGQNEPSPCSSLNWIDDGKRYMTVYDDYKPSIYIRAKINIYTMLLRLAIKVLGFLRYFIKQIRR